MFLQGMTNIGLFVVKISSLHAGGGGWGGGWARDKRFGHAWPKNGSV